jgi:Zn finger protein HypA/HybF involved in hydrogenase expression
MNCPKCGSDKVNVQMVTESQLKNKHHSIIYWLLIGWWLHPILWICLTLPMIFLRLFGHKKQKIVQKQKTTAVCQNCGHHWNI